MAYAKLTRFLNQIDDKVFSRSGPHPNMASNAEVRTLVNLVRTLAYQRDTIHNGSWKKDFDAQIKHVLEHTNMQGMPGLPDGSYVDKSGKWQAVVY